MPDNSLMPLFAGGIMIPPQVRALASTDVFEPIPFNPFFLRSGLVSLVDDRLSFAQYEDTEPYGMVGSTAIWNGNFTISVEQKEREVAPRIKGESAVHNIPGTGDTNVSGNDFGGEQIFDYTAASISITLEDECTGTWRDNVGEYPWLESGETTAGQEKVEAALGSCPQSPLDTVAEMTEKLKTDRPWSVRFTSRDGKQYRIIGWISQLFEESPTIEYEIITEIDSKRGEHVGEYDESIDTSFGFSHEIFSIEENTGTSEEPEWVMIARRLAPWESAEDYPYPDPFDLVENNVSEKGRLFATYRVRDGTMIGSSDYLGTGRTFRRERYVYTTTGQPTTTAPSVSREGGDLPNVSLSFNFLLDHTAQKDIEDEYHPNWGWTVNNFSRSIGGYDWGIDNDETWVKSMAINHGITITSTTATSKNGSRTSQDAGYASVSLHWDVADPVGVVVSSSVTDYAATIDTGQNVTPTIAVDDPEWHLSSYRCRYN